LTNKGIQLNKGLDPLLPFSSPESSPVDSETVGTGHPYCTQYHNIRQHHQHESVLRKPCS